MKNKNYYRKLSIVVFIMLFLIGINTNHKIVYILLRM